MTTISVYKKRQKAGGNSGLFINIRGRLMDYTTVQDSEERREYNTGAVRDRGTGKGRYDLLPPKAIHRLARHFENGAVKYGDRNWEKGIPISNYIDSAMRHIFKYLDGAQDEDHLIAGAWNLLCAAQTEVEHPELQDIPKRTEVAE
jgi:hypothetical protein